MIKYISQDGAVFTAEDNKGIVYQMMYASRSKAKEVEQYMKLVTRWTKIYTGCLISNHSFDVFLYVL